MRFLTLYPEGSNTELVKDVGQIPYTLAKYYNYDSALVYFSMDNKNTNFEYVKGLKLIHLHELKIKKGKFLSEAYYLLKNASNIDWLNLYHETVRNVLLMKIYKILNPYGHVYLKLDLDFKVCDKFDKDIKERKKLQRNCNAADIVSIESSAIKKRIQKYVSKDIIIIPNGLAQINRPNLKLDKSNTFITVARLGTEQKDTKTLVNAFVKSYKLHNWNLELIGSMTSKFKKYIYKLLDENPELKKRIIIKGEISNREKLYAELAKAKVFILDSKWEGFPLVLPEALSQGCSLIVSDQVPSAMEMTNNGKFGQIIQSGDVDCLSESMLYQIKNWDKYSVKSKVEYVHTNYNWVNICKELNNYMVLEDN